MNDLRFLRAIDNSWRILAPSGVSIEAGQDHPQVALLDVEMPILDGPGMAHEMFLHDMGLEEIPVVLLSGVTNLKEVAAQVGTPYFLGKPYRFEQVVALVDRALSERVAPQPRARRT